MTDYSTFNSVSSNGTSYGPISENTTSNNNNNANIFDIVAHNDLQAFTNTSQHHHHHFSQFYNQTQNVYNQINTDTFSQHHHHQNHHQIPALANYKNSASYAGMNASHTWKNFSVQNSASSASSSPHIETNANNTENTQCLQVQSNNFQSGKNMYMSILELFKQMFVILKLNF